MSSFSIPGNVKQAMLPFVINPEEEFNKWQTGKAASEITGKPQYFSFRNKTLLNHKGNSGRLNICPTSVKEAFNDDISYKLMFGPNVDTKNDITIETLFDQIPGIQIREYLPDTRLDQALDFFGKVIESLMDMFKSDKDKKKLGEDGKPIKDKDGKEVSEFNLGDLVTKIIRTCKFAVKYLTGFVEPNLYNTVFKDGKFDNLPVTNYNDATLNSNPGLFMLKFPFTMWYTLQSLTTTNIYELPCVPNDKTMYSSNGDAGWGSAGLSFSNSFIEGLPVIGKLAKSLLGNINVSMMPWWDAKAGNDTPHPDVVIAFDLFNDTDEAALYNFIFVNTIVPNNKWVQYNMFQHSPCLYDIKLEGYDRLYACTGQFKVEQVGVLRNMPDSWFSGNVKNGPKKNDYLNKHINECMQGTFYKDLQEHKLVKIPDVYHVTLTFKSVLPDNFNSFLFTYSKNANITTEYMKTGNSDIRFESTAIDLMKGVGEGIGNAVKFGWAGKTDKGKAIDENGDVKS